MIGEQLNFPDFGRDAPSATRSPNLLYSAIDQRRTDRALLNWQKFMRSKFVIAQRELGRVLYFEARAIAIVPFRRRMNLQLTRQFDPGCPPKCLNQNRRFNFQLPSVVRMLVVTPTTSREIWAAWLNPIRGGLQNSLKSRPRKSLLLLDNVSLYLLAINRERHEHSFAGPIFIARQAREPVSAIYGLFNFELHIVILMWDRPTSRRSAQRLAQQLQLENSEDRLARQIPRRPPATPSFRWNHPGKSAHSRLRTSESRFASPSRGSKSRA